MQLKIASKPSPLKSHRVHRNLSVNSESLLCVLSTAAAPAPHVFSYGSQASSSTGGSSPGAVGVLGAVPAARPVSDYQVSSGIA